MAEYLLVNDIHAADRPPSSCTDSYLPDLIDLLGRTVAVARERGVAAVVWAGDVFHIKAPGRTSHRLVQLMIGICRAYGVPVYIVPGNHDITHDRLASLDSQPLGTLFASGAAQRLEGWALDHPVLYGMPWQQRWDEDHVADALAAFRQKGRFGGLVVAHAPLYPPGQELPYENFLAEDWARCMGNDGYCWYGHVHESHGSYTVDNVTFANYGALSRGSVHEHNLSRDVSAGIWDSETCAFTRVSLDAKPAEKVFRLTEKKQVTDSSGRLDAFLASVGAAELTVVSVERVLAQARAEETLTPAHVALVEELLEVVK